MDSHLSSSTFTSFLTPDLISNQTASPPSFSNLDVSGTIKMEDLQNFSQMPSPPQSTRSSTSSEAKTAKKRKSWGQVLPEPKTSLPPRKRAKTEDEKEQRRIERVKRNRLAAHNSRERKRQEVEQLQSEKDDLARQLKEAQQNMRKLAAELSAYHAAMPNGPPGVQGLGIEGINSSVTSSIEDLFDTPNTNTINPRQASSPSPESMDSMDSPPETSSQPSTPFTDASVAEPDQTQHSAAMLWDLQCQSGISNRSLSIASQSAFLLSMASLILFNLQISMMTLLSTTSSIFHRSLIQRTLSSWNRKTSSTRRSRKTQSARLPFLNLLLQSTSTCSPTQAQQILLATRLASQVRSSSKAIGRSSGPGLGLALERDVWRRLTRLWKLSLLEQARKGVLREEIKRLRVALDNSLDKLPESRRRKGREAF